MSAEAATLFPSAVTMARRDLDIQLAIAREAIEGVSAGSIEGYKLGDEDFYPFAMGYLKGSLRMLVDAVGALDRALIAAGQSGVQS